MLVNYFNGCVRARSLGIVAEILVFADIWYDICAIIFLATFRKIQDYIVEEEEFEDLKD
jgi:hypothetical protein